MRQRFVVQITGAVMLLFLLPAARLLAAEMAPAGTLADTVTVRGNARLSLTPDRVTFTIGVQTTAPTVDDAVRQNNTRVSGVVDALKKAGATPDQIRTTNFSVYPQQVYQQGEAPRLTGYQVNNSVVVTTSKATTAGKLLQAAVDAGANNASGLNMSIADPEAARRTGLRQAYENAKSSAQALAEAAGRTLGRAIVISEEGMTPPPPRPMAMAMESRVAASSVPVEEGTLEMEFHVDVTFELR
ncbi:MAG: SIMPL domain-containing protein [Thermoanaerobaculia bacterium]